MAEEFRLILKNAGKIDPESIRDYQMAGGYQALAKARSMIADDLIRSIEEVSKLRGRGGAGFPTGFKWRGAAGVDSEQKYVVCNADEGEPGTFKDRNIIEQDPHLLIEGTLICAHAIGAKDIYIYVRGEYTRCIELLRKAAADAKVQGYTEDVSIHVVGGAGSYVCGEETTLLTSLEGYRGEPRLKPPFPTVAGFLGKPTVVNNVETFAAVPAIIEKGTEWFSQIGASAYPGTKLICLSGDIKRPGVYEVATDANLLDIINDLGGGMKEGSSLKAVQMGGGSCGFMTPDQLDVSIDFDSLRKIGASLGSGAVLVLDESHDMFEFCRSIAHFFAHESCGKCAPCREGTFRIAEIMDEIAGGNDGIDRLDQVKRLGKMMSQACFCPLGQGAANALISAMELFPGDFQAVD